VLFRQEENVPQRHGGTEKNQVPPFTRASLAAQIDDFVSGHSPPVTSVILSRREHRRISRT
jgi:hypothetical protein